MIARVLVCLHREKPSGDSTACDRTQARLRGGGTGVFEGSAVREVRSRIGGLMGKLPGGSVPSPPPPLPLNIQDPPPLQQEV